MNPINITLIILICVGVVSCIIALVWTKIIKPNEFGYTNKNMITKRNYHDIVKKLNSHSKVYFFEDVYLKFSEEENPIVFERILVTSQYVYIITNPLEKKVIGINIDKNSISLKYSKKDLDLPLDINLSLANAKLLQQSTKSQFIKIIIPFSNKNIIQFSHNNIFFVDEDKIYEQIEKIDSEGSEFRAKDFVELIKSKVIKRAPKRTFMNIKFNKKEF